MSFLAIGGTNVLVAQMSSGNNVGRTNVGGTNDGGTKVAPPCNVREGPTIFDQTDLSRLLPTKIGIQKLLLTPGELVPGKVRQ
jgi:hypothetical protein